MIFLDTETCGFHGPITLIQYAYNNDPVILYNPWYHTVQKTIDLIESFANYPMGIVGFNLVFDWFHLVQMYTVLLLIEDKSKLLSDCIAEYAEKEPLGRDGPCLKPVKACDLMLHARKGPYQSTMDRGDIRIRRVPTALAWELAKELDQRVPLKDIYFAKKKDSKERWKVYDIKDELDNVNPDFKDVVLKFAASSALKTLAVDALGLDPGEVLLFADIDPHSKPKELGYAPFAKAIGDSSDWKGAWPEIIYEHIVHWEKMPIARKYAEMDVILTRKLYDFFGRPELGDDDSELTCAVACIRWRGYKLDLEGIKALRNKTFTKKFKLIVEDGLEKKFKIPTAPKKVLYYIQELMTPVEKAGMRNTTKRIILEELCKLQRDCSCLSFNENKAFDISDLSKINYEELIREAEKKSNPDPHCQKCGGSGKVDHPSGQRAKEVLDARMADKEREVYDKLLQAGRFHASFAVIGTLSSRMGGGGSSKGIEGKGKAKGDKLNPQGIKQSKEVRGQFPMAWEGELFGGGDFAGFEVTIAEAVYKDSNLRKDLLTCEYCGGELEWDRQKIDFFCKSCGSICPCPKCQNDCTQKIDCKKCKGEGLIKFEGKKIHALFGVHVFTDLNYDQIVATSGRSNGPYDRSKKAVFASFYGAEAHTLKERLGVPIEIAQEAVRRFHTQYPGVGLAQKRVIEAFQSMVQPGGIGTQVIWREPADYIESMFGFRRNFTLENQICRTLFELANRPPKHWSAIKIKVLRRDREQTIGGAVQSALYGAAFQIQAGNTRAALNHEIQSAGATITKTVQRKIWDLQPSGSHKWLVQPCNIHDEILCPMDKTIAPMVEKVVNEAVESFRPKVPLIKMEWKSNLKTWADK